MSAERLIALPVSKTKFSARGRGTLRQQQTTNAVVLTSTGLQLMQHTCAHNGDGDSVRTSCNKLLAYAQEELLELIGAAALRCNSVSRRL